MQYILQRKALEGEATCLTAMAVPKIIKSDSETIIPYIEICQLESDTSSGCGPTLAQIAACGSMSDTDRLLALLAIVTESQIEESLYY